MESCCTNHLDVVVALTQCALGRLTDHGERFNLNVFQIRSVGKLITKVGCL